MTLEREKGKGRETRKMRIVGIYQVVFASEDSAHYALRCVCVCVNYMLESIVLLSETFLIFPLQTIVLFLIFRISAVDDFL